MKAHLEFRSDTMTLPSEAMRQAMRDAELGDDVVAEDPTVNKLQQEAADITGKEAALFVPSGTFGNQCAIATHTQPGSEAIVSETAHIITHEAGAAAALSGVQTRTVSPSHHSYLTVDDIAPRIRPRTADVHIPATTLIILENALANGAAMPLDAMKEVADLARRNEGIRIHLDGARLFNAALSLNISPSALCEPVDSVMFCVSKGLGAPVGSLLCGSAEFIQRARKIRKRFGGGMRQAGVLAAPALIALHEGVARLGDDHENARYLGDNLRQIPGIRLCPDTIETNMVFVNVEFPGRNTEGLWRYLQSNGILTYPPDLQGIRFVLCSRVNRHDVELAIKAVRAYMK